MIERLDETTTFIDFYNNFLIPNKPCIFEPCCTKDWKCRKEWVSLDGSLSIEFLKQNFGDAEVPITRITQPLKYDSDSCGSMIFSDFLDHLKTTEGGNCTEDLIYLKDWHHSHSFPDYHAYSTPKYFSSDWMNEYWDFKSDKTQQDYRFLYIGPKHSWTPFHADVLRSYSWSANICGRKLWYLVPPDILSELLQSRGGRPDSLSDIRDLGTDKELIDSGVILVEQEAGEIIFVPSYWYHQVHNLETTVSINHNWFNGANIQFVWKYIQDQCEKVLIEIADCRDSFSKEEFIEQGQKILKADIGIDFLEFRSLLRFIRERRQLQLKNRTSSASSCQCSAAVTELCDFCQNFVCDEDIETCDALLLSSTFNNCFSESS